MALSMVGKQPQRQHVNFQREFCFFFSRCLLNVVEEKQTEKSGIHFHLMPYWPNVGFPSEELLPIL